MIKTSHLSLLAIFCTPLILLSSAAFPAELPAALADPIPEPIPASDVTVALQNFVRLPETQDSAAPPQTNNAYARIQYLQPLPDGSGRLAINDLRGLLYLFDPATSSLVTYLDVREQGGEPGVGFDDSMFPNETGLAGVAFHPDFGNPGTPGYGRFYTAYSARAGSGSADYLEDPQNNHDSIIREWTAVDPAADSFQGSSREILRVGQFAQNHNIGTLAFNPAAPSGSTDFGLLYASFGDGGAANDPNENGQDLSTPLASIIRIDPLGGDGAAAYGIPPDNPFVTVAGAAPEIWAYGLRHPQHFSFARDGSLYIADIGQSQIEEVNVGVAGANYGWRIREGTFATAFEPAYLGSVRPGPVYPLPAEVSVEASTVALSGTTGLVPAETTAITYPVLQYDHTPSNAISSVFLYEGAGIPALRNRLVLSDMVTGRIYYADSTGLQPGRPAALAELQVVIDGTVTNIADALGFANTYAQGNRADARLGVDEEGELYLLTKGDGWVRKLVAP
ncbi:MAG: PQQ-dependent sugar dehydrogenase [Gammaproteobacteria bacterium]